MRTFNPFCWLLFLIAFLFIVVVIIKATNQYFDECSRKWKEEEEDIFSDL